MPQTTILPLWLLAAVIALGVALGWVALEVSGSLVVMSLATAASWGAATLARRRRAARGAGPRFRELPSGDLDEQASLGRRVVARTACVIGYLTVALGLGTLLEDLEPEAVGALGAGDLIGLIAAVPVWYEIDARLGIRGARLRREEEARLQALADQERLSSPVAVATVPAARLRPLLLAGSLFAGCVVAPVAVAGDGVVQLVLIAAGAAVLGFFSILLALRALRSPFFLRVSADGVDPLGRGLVPWSAIEGFYVFAHAHQRFLAVVLHADGRPEDAGWWRKGHRALGRGTHNATLSLPLMLCGARDEELFAALKSFTDSPVGVDLS